MYRLADTHTEGEKTTKKWEVDGRWVYGLDHNGDSGGVRGLKDRISRHFRAFRGDKVRSLAYCLRLGTNMVRTVCSRAALRHTPVRPTHPAIRGNRGHKENKCRGVKQICSTKNEHDWWEGKRSENRFKKT